MVTDIARSWAGCNKPSQRAPPHPSIRGRSSGSSSQHTDHSSMPAVHCYWNNIMYDTSRSFRVYVWFGGREILSVHYSPLCISASCAAPPLAILCSREITRACCSSELVYSTCPISVNPSIQQLIPQDSCYAAAIAGSGLVYLVNRCRFSL